MSLGAIVSVGKVALITGLPPETRRRSRGLTVFTLIGSIRIRKRAEYAQLVPESVYRVHRDGGITAKKTKKSEGR